MDNWQIVWGNHMIIGIPKEIKDKEFRVGIVPAGVQKLAEAGHGIIIEADAGIGSEIFNREFKTAGARLVQDAATVYREADLVMKVKEPLEQEYEYMREGLLLFTYLHLAPLPELTQVFLKKKLAAGGCCSVELPALNPVVLSF
jgi:alanine dehydrogenase